MVEKTNIAPKSPASRPPSISVVIRSFTKTEELRNLIEALARQNLPPAEIVDIDSGSPEPVIQELRDFARNGVPGIQGVIPLRLIEIPNSEYQSARALNHAIEASCGEFVAIISQDALPDDEHYLRRLAEALAGDPKTAGSYARQILGEEYHPLGEKDLEKTYPPVSRIQEAPDCWFVNTCSLIRRELFDRHAFDEEALISEDHEWGRWVQEQGYNLRYVAEAKVRHYHHFGRLPELWDRHFQEGRGLARIHREGPGLAMALFCYLREVASDGLWLIRNGKPWYLPSSVLRRAVKHAALYRGHRVGD